MSTVRPIVDSKAGRAASHDSLPSGFAAAPNQAPQDGTSRAETEQPGPAVGVEVGVDVGAVVGFVGAVVGFVGAVVGFVGTPVGSVVGLVGSFVGATVGMDGVGPSLSRR